MSERWKYQLKTGLPFGLMMPIALTSMDWYYTSFAEAFFSVKFLIKLIIFLVVGVFLIGYSNWRAKKKEEEYSKQK